MQRSFIHVLRRSALSSMRHNRATVMNTTCRALSTSTSSNFSEGQFGSFYRFSLFGLAATSVVAVSLTSEQAKCDAATLPPVYNDLRADIVKIMDTEEERRGDGTGIGPTFVRLAWHAAGSYSKADNSGGSNGATMRFNPESNWGGNAGLGMSRRLLEPLKEKYPSISIADIWTFAGKVAIEEMGGPVIPWKPGRTDADDGSKCVPEGRLPNADAGDVKGPKTIQHIRDIFYRMGFNDQEIVALSGAHALGRCHVDNSGYWGPWTNAETTFSNEYFRLLVEEKWTIKKTHKGKPWRGPTQFEDKTGNLMMLPSDMALVEDPAFKKWVEVYAKDQDKFFADFAAAFSKLLELGVKFPSSGSTGGFDIMSYVNQIKSILGL